MPISSIFPSYAPALTLLHERGTLEFRFGMECASPEHAIGTLRTQYRLRSSRGISHRPSTNPRIQDGDLLGVALAGQIPWKLSLRLIRMQNGDT
jgi:hypothetical protein